VVKPRNGEPLSLYENEGKLNCQEVGLGDEETCITFVVAVTLKKSANDELTA